MLKADPSNTPPRANVEIEQAAETLGSKGKRKEGQRLGKEGPLTAACRNASMIYQRRLWNLSESTEGGESGPY